MEYFKSPNPCPKCGEHQWWAEYRTHDMKWVTYTADCNDVLAFRYCKECKHYEAGAMVPTERDLELAGEV